MVAAVEPPEQVELGALLIVGHLVPALQVVDRSALGIECGPLVNAGQETRAPVRRVAFGQASAEGVVHHDKPRQVLVLGAQPVRHPRPDTGEAHPAHPGVDLEQSRGVVVRLGKARVNERHLIHVPGQVRKELRDPGARPAVAGEFEGRLHQGTDLGREKTGVLVEAGQLLAVVPVQRGLVVPGIHLARAAVHEEPDDRLRPRREVRRPGGQRIRGSWRTRPAAPENARGHPGPADPPVRASRSRSPSAAERRGGSRRPATARRTGLAVFPWR